MLNGFLIFFFLGVGDAVRGTKCPPMLPPLHGTVSCFWKNKTSNCESSSVPGSVAKFTCLEFYRLAEKGTFLECLENGSWSSTAPSCIADCGRRGNSVSLIVNGAVASRGSFPWHSAIYNFLDDNYEYICGASLISEVAVLTAAHCTWNIPPEKLTLAFGKFHREFDFPEQNVQKIKAKSVKVLDSYQDVTGNYNGDVAVIFLDRRVVLGHYSAPVCIDWDQKLMKRHLVEGALGVALGWGLTENDTLSDVLRLASLPVVSDEKCIAEQEQDFKKFVTYTSFCAGFGNGSGVCNGDSGGGLTFFDEASGRWYLQGLVSVSPRRKGTPYCDSRFYTVFTKVAMFSKWLTEMKAEMSPHEHEQHNGNKDVYAFVKKYFNEESYKIGERKTLFPHSKKILELAKILKLPENNQKLKLWK